MKICLISNWYKPHAKSGAGIYVNNIAKALSERGHEIIVITMLPEYDGRESLRPQLSVEEGIKVYRFHPILEMRIKKKIGKKEATVPLWYATELYNPHANQIIKKILKIERPDLVHANCLRGMSLSVIPLVNQMDIPIIYTAHDYRLICPLGTLLKRSGKLCCKPRAVCRMYGTLTRKAVNCIDAILTPSQFVMDMHVNQGFFKDTEKHVVPLGIDIDNIPPMRYEKKTGDGLKVLYVGQLVKHKGVQVLIEAFKNLENKNVRLDIVGDGPYEKQLEQLADGDERIYFHGKKTNEDLGAFYLHADVSVVPSVWYDNSPLVIYEALSHGVPVIASRIGGIPELVKDGYNGYTFEAGNNAELQLIMKDFIDDPSNLTKLKKDMIESGKNFSINEHIYKLELIYKGMVEGY